MLSNRNRGSSSSHVNRAEFINDTKKFESAIRLIANIRGNESLTNELQLVIENYRKHRKLYKEAKLGTPQYDYSVMRLKELWKWTSKEGYEDLTTTLNMLGKSNGFDLDYNEKHIALLFSHLNYLGVLHDGEAQASENFYAMIELVKIISFNNSTTESQQEFMSTIDTFKSIFIIEQQNSTLSKDAEEHFSKPINIDADLLTKLKKANTIEDYKSFAQKAYDALEHIVRFDLLPRLSAVAEKSLLTLDSVTSPSLFAWTQKFTSSSRRGSSAFLTSTSPDPSLSNSTSSSSVTSSSGDDSSRNRLASLGSASSSSI